MASIYSGSDAGKSGLEMVELDGSPDVRGVTKIKVSNTTLTDDGNGEVTLTTGGGGGGGMTSWTLRGNSGSNQTITDADNVTFSGSGGLATVASAVDTLTVQTTGVLEDLNTLGAPTADGEFIVATGAGAFAYETGATVRTSLGLGTMATQNANAVSITGGTISGVSGVGSPSAGNEDQFNVSDGSGGWDGAAVYYGNAGGGQLGIGTTSLSSYGLTVLQSGVNVAVFNSTTSPSVVAFHSSTTTNQNVAIKSSSNTMTLVSGGVDFAMPTADGTNGQVLTTDGAGNLSFATAASDVPLLKNTGTYTSGVSTDIDFAVPTGTRTNVAFQVTVYLEDSTPADSAMVTFDGILVRSTGAPLAPTFAFVIVPGTDGGSLSLGTGGINTLRITLTTPTGSGDYVATVRLTED